MTFQNLNPILGLLPPSPTISLMDRARELKSNGRDIVSLAGGEPDMPPASSARRVGAERLLRGDVAYGPVPGLSDLRRAIAEHVKRRHGINYSAQQIVVGVGAKQVLCEALMVATLPGDEIIIPAPYWVSYPAMAQIAGGVPRIVETGASTGFKLTAEALASTLTSRSRWLILNSPGNPTGAIYSKKELSALAEVVASHPRLLVLSDDIYEDIVFDGALHTTIASVAPDVLLERTVHCSGLSKGHALTGMRVGYAAGPSWIVEPMISLQSHLTSGGCVVGQATAAAALASAREFPLECVSTYARRRVAGLKALTTPGIKAAPPAGAFYFWIDVEGLMGRHGPDGRALRTADDLASMLLDEVGLALVAGSAFGARGNFLRMSFAAADELLLEGCRRLAMFASNTQ